LQEEESGFRKMEGQHLQEVEEWQHLQEEEGWHLQEGQYPQEEEGDISRTWRSSIQQYVQEMEGW